MPEIVRRELGIEGKGKIPYFIAPNMVLLIRKDVELADLLKALDLLKQKIELRSEVLQRL